MAALHTSEGLQGAVQRREERGCMKSGLDLAVTGGTGRGL